MNTELRREDGGMEMYRCYECAFFEMFMPKTHTGWCRFNRWYTYAENYCLCCAAREWRGEE